MKKREKAELLDKVKTNCLRTKEMLFEGAIQLRDFESAFVWMREYFGALKMLDALGLISWDEYKARQGAMWERYAKGKYPNTCQEEGT